MTPHAQRVINALETTRYFAFGDKEVPFVFFEDDIANKIGVCTFCEVDLTQDGECPSCMNSVYDEMGEMEKERYYYDADI